MRRQISRTGLAALAVVSFAGAALAAEDDINSVMSSISIDPGRHVGGVSDVNGSIRIGANAIVENVHDVNGSIHVDAGARAQSLSTVNGAVHVGEGVHVAHEVHAENGSISIGSGSEVGSVSGVNGSVTVTGTHIGGEVRNVNGVIRILSSHVGGSVIGMNGNIDIGANSRVDGELRVRKGGKEGGWFNWWALFFFSSGTPRVVIGPGAVVAGPLVFEQDVKLYVSDRATVGPIKGATPIKFNGSMPPD